MAATTIGGKAKSVPVSASSSGANTLVAAVTGSHIRVLGCILIATADITITFQTGAGGTGLSGAVDMKAGVAFTLPVSDRGWMQTAVSTLLNLNLSGGVKVAGVLIYDEV